MGTHHDMKTGTHRKTAKVCMLVENYLFWPISQKEINKLVMPRTTTCIIFVQVILFCFHVSTLYYSYHTRRIFLLCRPIKLIGDLQPGFEEVAINLRTPRVGLPQHSHCGCDGESPAPENYAQYVSICQRIRNRGRIKMCDFAQWHWNWGHYPQRHRIDRHSKGPVLGSPAEPPW